MSQAKLYFFNINNNINYACPATSKSYLIKVVRMGVCTIFNICVGYWYKGKVYLKLKFKI